MKKENTKNNSKVKHNTKNSKYLNILEHIYNIIIYYPIIITGVFLLTLFLCLFLIDLNIIPIKIIYLLLVTIFTFISLINIYIVIMKNEEISKIRMIILILLSLSYLTIIYYPKAKYNFKIDNYHEEELVQIKGILIPTYKITNSKDKIRLSYKLNDQKISGSNNNISCIYSIYENLTKKDEYIKSIESYGYVKTDKYNSKKITIFAMNNKNNTFTAIKITNNAINYCVANGNYEKELMK